MTSGLLEEAPKDTRKLGMPPESLKPARPASDAPIPQALFFRRALVGLLVCLGTFLLAEAAARLLVVLAHPLQSHAQEYDRKYQLAQMPVTGHKPVVLVLGDSMMDFALYPELLRTRLKNAGIDAEVRNLAVPGNTFETASFLLRAALAKGIRPTLVIYDVHPRLFNQSAYQQTIGATGRDFNSSYLGTCKAQKLSPLGKANCALQSAFYLVGYRRFLKDELVNLPDTIFNPKKRLKYDPGLYPKQEVSPGGWAPGYEIQTAPEFSEKYSKKEYLAKVAGDIGHYRWTDAHFLPFRNYCKAHKLPLLMVWLPEHPIFKNYYRQLNVDETGLQTHLATLFQNRAVGFADLHESLADTLDYHTPDHLNPLGAIATTDRIAALVLSAYGDRLKSQSPAAQPATSAPLQAGEKL